MFDAESSEIDRCEVEVTAEASAVVLSVVCACTGPTNRASSETVITKLLSLMMVSMLSSGLGASDTDGALVIIEPAKSQEDIKPVNHP